MADMTSLTIRLSDGYDAYARLWMPAQPDSAVLYLHGIQSHGGWFEQSAKALADAGCAVLLPDRRGSGRNQVDRGHLPSARRMLQDTAECLNELHVRTGFSRFHLVGISWGGKLAMAMLRTMPERIASLVLVAPGLFPQVDLPLREKIRVGTSALLGGRAMFDIPLNDPNLFTANPPYQEFIRTDPLALRKVTASFLLASRRLDRIAMACTDVPSHARLHVFLAGHDRIIHNPTTRSFIRALSGHRDLTEYPDAHHTLEFEPNSQLYQQDLIQCIRQASLSR